MTKQLLIALLFSISLYAETIIYTKNNIHAFLPKNGEISFKLAYQAMNDTLDIFNVKESEFSGNSQNIDSLGAMQGFDIGIGYSFYDDFYLNANINQQHLQYSSSTLVNTNVDLYIRYNIYSSTDLAFAIDGGYVLNHAKDLYIKDINTINSNIKKIAPDKDIKISADGTTLNYTGSNGTLTIPLTLEPYASIEDTKDDAFYFRLLSSYKTKSFLFDVFAGYKQINIQYTVDTSLTYEPELEEEFKNNSPRISNKRVDATLFMGASLRYQIDSLYTTFGYRYNNILRIDGLEEIQENHIIDLDFLYSITPNIGAYLGFHAMSNQFNGEINYLYTQYSKTSFDHPYGYISIGTVLKF